MIEHKPINFSWIREHMVGDKIVEQIGKEEYQVTYIAANWPSDNIVYQLSREMLLSEIEKGGYYRLNIPDNLLLPTCFHYRLMNPSWTILRDWLQYHANFMIECGGVAARPYWLVIKGALAEQQDLEVFWKDLEYFYGQTRMLCFLESNKVAMRVLDDVKATIQPLYDKLTKDRFIAETFKNYSSSVKLTGDD